MTTRDWIEVAVRMQRRAELAALLGRHREASSYLRRRDYCARKAKDQGREPWRAISAVVGEVDLIRCGTTAPTHIRGVS